MGICTNCHKTTINNYYGYCSSSCCADFAVKHDLMFNEAQYEFVNNERIEELEYEVDSLWKRLSDAESDANYFEEEAEESYRFRDKCHEAEDDNKYLKKVNKKLRKQNEDLLETLKEMRSYSDRFQLISLGTEDAYENEVEDEKEDYDDDMGYAGGW